MKLVTFRHADRIGAGFLAGDAIVVCEEGAEASGAVRRVIEAGDAALEEWLRKAGTAEHISLESATLMAPIPVPRRDIFCVGKNYYAHAAEFHSSGFDSSAKEEVPTAPVIFTKATTSVCGPGDGVKASLDPTQSVDYEGELGVVVGKRAFGVKEADAFDYVFGYTVINDVTSRELQRRHNQWVIGKGVDTFCPMGPTIVTADEVGDIDALELVTEVNGEERQRAKVSDLIFDIPSLIATMTKTMTLLSGDIIATGTPVGVGIGFKPPKYLAPGDVMRVTISGIGTLENPVE
ncbi:MAG: fumarylacetoacetate hydrolase family protein [Pseudomonadota bacterium]